MNIRNVMIMFLMLGGCQLIRPFNTAQPASLKITNNLNEKVFVCINGDKSNPRTIEGKKDLTMPYIPDKLGVKKEGSIFHESRMQTALEDIQSEIHNKMPANTTSITAYMNINGIDSRLHPFEFKGEVKFVAPPNRPTEGPSQGQLTPEEADKLILTAKITFEKYFDIIADNPQKYGTVSGEIKQLRDNFNRQSDTTYKNTLSAKNHPYKITIRNLTNTYRGVNPKSSEQLLSEIRKEAQSQLSMLPNYLRITRERHPEYNLVD